MFSLLVLLAVLVPGAADQTLPRFTHPPQHVERDPLWVSVDEAFSPDGELREGVFSRSARHTMPHQVVVSAGPGEPRKPGSDCLGGIASTGLHFSGPDRTLLDLTRGASRIAAGAIVAATPGFLEGLAGTLLELRVDESLKGRFSAASIFVFYPYVYHRSGRVTVCRSDLRYNLRPGVGNRALFFSFYPSRDVEDTLFEHRPNHLMLEGVDGSLETEPAFRDPTAPNAFGDVVEHVRGLIRIPQEPDPVLSIRKDSDVDPIRPPCRPKAARRR